jgi:signal transduction histidine kinase
VRDSRAPVVIDDVSTDATYCDHHTPRMYGFQSYISVPVFRPDGEYFGTLCGFDPLPAKLSTPATLSSLSLFAQLLSLELENERVLVEAREALLRERGIAELREQFIAVLGHDLRNPLGSIMTSAEVLLLQNPNPKSVPVIERLRRSARRMSTLVDDVLDFTRGRMGGGIAVDMHQESALHQVFEQVVAELRDLYPSKKICAELPPIEPIYCDAGRMSQMLSNLLKNALVHGEPDSIVHVAAYIKDQVFTLSVTNTGPTIAPSVIGQLFKPFWRGMPSASDKGLGLGLFIVSEIARSHGGKIDVVSKNNRTAFIYTARVHKEMGMKVSMAPGGK